MRRVAPVLVLGVALLAGCSGAAVPAQPGIAARSDVVVEERSTCEALGRVDLGLVGQDPASLDRSATALENAGTRAPTDIGPMLTGLAASYRDSVATATTDPQRETVLAWFNQRCGGSR